MTEVPSFAKLQQASLPMLQRLIPRWLSNGHRQGDEWVAYNPLRSDRTLGSFKVNLRTGHWADFSTGDKGGDAISLLAYLRRVSQAKAARLLARELRVRL